MTETKPIAGLDWIAVDWGTSSLRVWAMTRDGAVLARRASQDGMSTLDSTGYEAALMTLIGGFLPPACATPVPVLVCGMAGAKSGWAEAGYRTVPCAPLAVDGMIRVETSEQRIAVRILPGLCQAKPADVMRGEETQIAGLIAAIGADEAVACLPGTHSKWARVGSGRVLSFATFMTGELFAILGAHSILRHSVTSGDEDRQAFLRAVRETFDDPQALTSALFSVRAASVLDGLPPASARSRLSGLLIGAELAATRDLWREGPVHVVGADSLADTYCAAIEAMGGSTVRYSGETSTLAGLSAARNLVFEALS